MVARVLIAILASLAAAGCKKQSELYCGMHPGDLDNCGYLDAGIDARPTCMVEADCAGLVGAPHCEPNAQVCVECYLPEHCAMNPVEKFCDPQTLLCTSCIKNADCASDVCLPNGLCGDDTNVAYVDPMAMPENVTCTAAAPCSTVDAALLTKKPFIKLEADIVEPVIISATAVTILAEPGTTLRRGAPGVVLTVNMGSDVTVYNVSIIGDDEKGVLVDKSTLRLFGCSVTGCNHKDRRAIEVKGSALVMSRTTVFANAGGGVLTDATSTFNITNSFIYRNGANDSMVGGLSLGATTSGLNRFEMNTVVHNRVTGTADAGGLYCASSLRAPNNLIVMNYAGDTATVLLNANKPLTGGCSLDDSIVDTDIAPYAFVTPDGAGPWDYHIGPGSMAIDRGVTSDIVSDIDGDARPYNLKIDHGADEYSP
jgi:hypothetical protein